MQKEILEKNPNAKIQVYAIWFSMIPTDGRAMWRWGSGSLTDSRVAHFWDAQKIVGRWYGENVSPDDADGGIVWDSYYLYPPGVEWSSKPPEAIASGGTVRDKFDELNQKVQPLLSP